VRERGNQTGRKPKMRKSERARAAWEKRWKRRTVSLEKGNLSISKWTKNSKRWGDDPLEEEKRNRQRNQKKPINLKDWEKSVHGKENQSELNTRKTCLEKLGRGGGFLGRLD